MYILYLFIFLSLGFNQDCLGGEIRTFESYNYGRFEVKMKPALGNGYVSSFFTYHDFWETPYGSWETYINEIDIEFTGNLNNSIQFTTHHPGNWSLTHINDLNFNPFDDYHDYAFEWTPTYVKWFVNGVEVYSQTEDVVDDLVYPHKIMMNIWSAIYEDWVGEWDPSTLPVKSYYDYVKYYEYDELNGDYGTNNSFSLSWSDEFNNFNQSRWIEATHGFNGNNCQFHPVNVLIHNGKLILYATEVDFMLGDVNSDEILNIIDLVSIVDMILSFTEAVNTADYNQDNILNIIDLIFIIDNILS